MLMEQNNSQEMKMLKHEQSFRRSHRVFSTIVMAINTTQLYLVTSYYQPNDAWDILRNHFECET